MLVEGISDKIFFDRVFDILASEAGKQRDPNLEIVSVGGKGFFSAYQKLLEACKVQGQLIADLDYIEQIGDSDVKNLFKVNMNEIKREVIESSKSLDGDSLVKHIDQAIASGDWSHASDVWNYIKSRRVVLKDQLDAEERKKLASFIAKKSRKGTFLLSLGALEEYLPQGYASKDLDKLIKFVASESFWEELPVDGRMEIARIGRKILSLPTPSRQKRSGRAASPKI